MSMIPTRPHNARIPLGEWCHASGSSTYQVSQVRRSVEVDALLAVEGGQAQEPALLAQSVEEIEAAGFRFCSSCHRWQDMAAFHRRADCRRGVHYQCAVCRAKADNRKLEFKRRKRRK